MGQRPWLSGGADFIGAPCAPTLGPAAVSQICAQSYPGSPVTQACAGRASRARRACRGPWHKLPKSAVGHAHTGL